LAEAFSTRRIDPVVANCTGSPALRGRRLLAEAVRQYGATDREILAAVGTGINPRADSVLIGWCSNSAPARWVQAGGAGDLPARMRQIPLIKAADRIDLDCS